MKPLNSDNPGCNPISSNCVIWQGPDIACINLCKGDTVSDVVYQVATELCNVQSMLSLADGNYNISCFNLTSCLPSDFQELINLLISRICNLESCTGCAPACDGTFPTPIPAPANGCPDCEMTIAPCFEYIDGIGDTITTLQLKDYVTAIGNKICNLILTNNLTDTAITTLVARVDTLETQVTIIEDTQYIPPSVTPVCVLPSVPTEMNLVLTALETQFCTLRYATGTATDLYLNISKQCAGLGTSPKLAPGGGPMAAIPGWSNTVDNLAQSFGNMWITLCDIRSAVQNIQVNCCPTGCSGIVLNLFASLNLDTNYLSIYVNGTIPPELTQCTGNTMIKITDSSGNSITTTYDMIANLNSLLGYGIALNGTLINTALNLTIEIQPCLTNLSTGTTCESCLEYVLINTPACPVTSIVPLFNSATFGFTSAAGTFTYTVEVWDALFSTLISTYTIVTTTAAGQSVTITDLEGSTTYGVRLTVVATGSTATPVICPFTTFTTYPDFCYPPSAIIVTASVIPL
jgi:hypothetical protein